MNFIKFLRELSGDEEAFDKRNEEIRANSKKERFNVGGKHGLKWKKESANKTWIENGKVVKEHKGKTIPKY